ncbi:MAG: hypothetical protein LIO86_04720 [Lachnospiraceae bacterium]|nr:hypothetical protein [Lachnospiraceae bacterium]
MRKWAVIFLAAVLAWTPLIACAEAPEAAFIEMEDGEYAIDVAMEGGSGKVTISSPAILIVEDGRAYARIEWSSTHYDYMKVEDETYYPINDDGGYSTFEIPITVFNEAMTVIGDTTAMSTPHEVEYTLVFDSESITSSDQTPQAAAQRVVYTAIAIIAVCMGVGLTRRMERQRDSEKWGQKGRRLF